MEHRRYMSKGSRKVVDFPRRESIEIEAASWVVRRGSEDFGPADETAFAAWLKASERHRDAFRRLAATWEDAAVLEELDDIADSVEEDAGSREAPPWRSIGMLASAACVMAVIVGVMLTSALEPGPGQAQENQQDFPRDYVTGVGEQRTIDLDDGSSIRLNTDSAVSVDMTAASRQVRLLQGEAFFDVAEDQRRPFTVESPAGSVRALGTSFATRLKDRRILEVTVAEGRVEMTPPEAPLIEGTGRDTTDEPIEVAAGSTATWTDGGPTVKAVTENELERRLSWRGGVVAFAGEPLRIVIEDVSRYTDVEIRIADAAIESLPIGGFFRIGEVEALLESLELVFGIEVQRTESGEIVLAQRE